MSNELLSYYNKELTELQQLGSAFAKAHPKIARNLGIGTEGVEDPHVSRLIESVAFLNARVRRKLDDSLPDSIKALLDILYPHYQAPIPSMAMVQFPTAPGIDKSYTVDRHTRIETDPNHGPVCSFRTCYNTTVQPLTITDAKLTELYQAAPKLPFNASTPSVLRLSLQLTNKEASFADLAPDSLRFFIQAGSQLAYKIHELLFNDVVAIAFANNIKDTPRIIDTNNLHQVGFGADETMLPYPETSFAGFRLLTEFFVFPEKFLFFELSNLTAANFNNIDNTLEIFFYLKQPHHDLKTQIDATNFVQGCTPVINLLSRHAEPITLTHTEAEYPIVPDARRTSAYEVYSVDNVTALGPNGEKVECTPFYGLDHNDTDADTIFWQKTRRDIVSMDKADNIGTELCLSLVDTTGVTMSKNKWVISPTVTCTNRNLPRQYFVSGITPRLQFAAGGAPAPQINWIITPTPSYKPPLNNDNQWRLMSHLALNNMSLTIEDGSALKELLHLYNFTNKDEIQMMIDGIAGIKTKRATARIPGATVNSFAAGLEVTVDLNTNNFPPGQIILFGSLLEHFLPMYCNINSFTQLIITTDKHKKELHRWQPRTGSKQLL